MSQSNPIVKLTYKHKFFDISEMRIGGRTVTTINEDGTIIEQNYKPRSRKAYKTRKTTCDASEFRALCDKLENCIDSANDWDMWVDDSSEELKLFYKFNRVQIVDRGLCNGDMSIGGIMREFFSLVEY